VFRISGNVKCLHVVKFSEFRDSELFVILMKFFRTHQIRDAVENPPNIINLSLVRFMSQEW
jgi:hypothetical protein